MGGFLAGPQNPNREWAAMAKSFLGKYKTPTLRNVDKRPRADFVKAYMHNGYLKSLKEVVHFYNTRDALPRCKPGRSWREGNVLAGARESGDDQSKTTRRFETDRQAGRPVGGISQDPYRRLLASGKVVRLKSRGAGARGQEEPPKPRKGVPRLPRTQTVLTVPGNDGSTSPLPEKGRVLFLVNAVRV